MDPELIARAQRAHAAIAQGRDPQLVAARFRELSGGMDLPSPAVLQGYGQAQAAPEPEVPLPTDNPAAPPFARDALRFTPEQAKAITPMLATIPTLAIPGMGAAANIAVGSALGGLLAEPGSRGKGALIGGALSAIPEAGVGLYRIGKALKAPAEIRALAGEVPALRAAIKSEARQATTATREGARTATREATAAARAQHEGLFARAKGEASALSARASTRAADRANQTGSILAARVRELGGVTQNIDESIALAKQGREAVREAAYRPFDGPVVDDGLKKFLAKSGLAKSLGDDAKFIDLQTVRNQLGRFGPKQDIALRDALTREMEKAYPGLREADAQYAIHSAVLRNLQRGQRVGGRSAAQIREIQATLKPNELAAFREGQIADLTQKLTQKQTGEGAFKRLLDGGDEMDQKLRTIFPDDERFMAIKAAVEDERAAVAEIKSQAASQVGRIRAGAAQGARDIKAGLLADRETIRSGMLAQQEGTKRWSERMLSRADQLELQREAMQESADRLAKRIKIIATVAGAGALSKEFLIP